MRASLPRLGAPCGVVRLITDNNLRMDVRAPSFQRSERLMI